MGLEITRCWSAELCFAASVALLTVYDMCKAIDRNMVIESVRLVEKRKEDIDGI